MMEEAAEAEASEAEGAVESPITTVGAEATQATTEAEVSTAAAEAEAMAETAAAEAAAAEMAAAERAATAEIAIAMAEVTRFFSWHPHPPNGLHVHLVCL